MIVPASRQSRSALGLAVLMAAAGLCATVSAQVIALDRPANGQFIVDRAGLIMPGDAEHIQSVCQRLQAEKGVPIIVVSISAMRDHGGPDLRVETFATLLFDQWGIGSPDPNLGVLLLVAKNDRVSRIALGADWERSADGEAQRIMNEDIIPRFKSGRFSEGIAAGVDALDALARRRDAEPQVMSTTTQPATLPPASVPVSPISLPQRASHQTPFPASSPNPFQADAFPRTTYQSSSGGFGGGMMVIAIVVGIVLTVLRALTGSRSYGGWGGGYYGPRSSGGFMTGLLLGSHMGHRHGGGMFGGGMGGHRGGFGGGGSSFGGGSTRGGGATGRW